MKYLGYGLLLVVLILTGYDLFFSRRGPSIKDTRRGSIVRLVDNGRTYCTGVVVSPTVIITASHCVILASFGGIPVVNDKPIDIRLDNNIDLNVKGKVYHVDPQLDHALLFGDFSMFKPRPYISDVDQLNDIRLKDPTLKSWYPLGGPLYCSDQYFLDLEGFMWSTTGLLLPGMSGGPVFLPDGTVVAINVAVQEAHSIVSPIYNIDMYFRNR